MLWRGCKDDDDARCDDARIVSHEEGKEYRETLAVERENRSRASSSSSSGENDVEVVIKVPDMMCEGCSETVTNALKSESSVGEISIDLETKLVSVNVRGSSAVEAMAKIPTLVEALKENGFDSEPVFD